LKTRSFISDQELEPIKKKAGETSRRKGRNRSCAEIILEVVL
jgi:hypothetical protein